MKIGIHLTKNFFSERWIEYCKSRNIDYKLVDCYRSDIIQQLSDCDGLMWHFNHKGAKESKFAKQLLFSAQLSGKKTFPDFNTVWHFDDKVGQKYLLEALNLPLVNSYVFYSKDDALDWAEKTFFPKVFKLRNGAGSDNVRLVKSKKQANHLIKKAFDKGYQQYNPIADLRERYRKFKLGKSDLLNVFRGLVRFVYPTEYARLAGREIGYVYFQDFIPGNDFDIRVVVIGDKAFALKRLVRENDFRASGSGSILYEKEHFGDETIKIAFESSKRLKAQCLAYDFLYFDGRPLIIEISYGFDMKGYDPCVGYWDSDIIWHEGKFNPYGWMIENLIKETY